MHFCQSRITMVVSRGRLGAAGGQRGEVRGPPRSCLTLPRHLTRLCHFTSFVCFPLCCTNMKLDTLTQRPQLQPSPVPRDIRSWNWSFLTGGTRISALGEQEAEPLLPTTSQVSRAVSCQAVTSRAESTEPAQSVAPQQAKPKQSQQSLPGASGACQIPRSTRHPADGAGSQRAQGAERSRSFTGEYIPG